MSSNQAEKKNIAFSAVLNVIRKAFMIAFPLVTYAYATRVLGTEGIGIYEFAQSIVSYFALIAALGISQYAVRDGAEYLKETRKEEMSRFSSEVFSINLVMTLVSYGLLAILVCSNTLLYTNRAAIFIYSISILFTTLGVDWINSLFEDYLFLTVRYIVVSVISLGLLFAFVKTPEDINKYVAISIFATVVNGLLNYIYIQKYVKVRFTFKLNLAKHGWPIFVLFCNNIASVIYLNSDITILKILTDNNNVGLYGVAAKIYTMIRELINAAIFVTIPRFSMYVSEQVKSDIEEDERYIKGLKGLITPLAMILVPACVGLYVMAENVVEIVAGSAFSDAAGALRILAVAMFFAVMACFLAYAIILPHKLERYFLFATSLAAIINIVLNFIMIPVMGMRAAAVTTLIAEIMVFTMLGLLANRRVKVFDLLNIKDCLAVIVGSILVGILCIIIMRVVPGMGIAGTIILVTAAVILYLLVHLLFRSSALDYINMLKNRGNKE